MVSPNFNLLIIYSCEPVGDRIPDEGETSRLADTPWPLLGYRLVRLGSTFVDPFSLDLFFLDDFL